MGAQSKDRLGIELVTDEGTSVASVFEEVLWWQTLAINRLHMAGLTMSNVACHDDVASVSTAREHSRALLFRVVDDVEHALRLLEPGARSEALSEPASARIAR